LQYAKWSWIQINWNFWKLLKIDWVIAKWPLYFWPLKMVILLLLGQCVMYIRITKYKYNSIIMNYHKQTKDMRLCK
jgi:hypothetical protein